MSIVSKKGDDGWTTLIDGSSVEKSDLQPSGYGTVDELFSFSGVLKSLCKENNIIIQDKGSAVDVLDKIQQRLIVLMAELATPKKMVSTLLKDRIKEEDIIFIEELIYDLENKTCKIDGFVIPGANIIEASSHFARTICRRAERQIVAMRSSLDENSLVIPFINRLSDFFFIFAVYISKDHR